MSEQRPSRSSEQGPVGLAAAAHVLERGMTPIVLEAGPEAGHSVRQWQHVQLFSPWEYNVDKAAERLLAPTGWNSPDPQVYPTGAELLERYLEPLATKTLLRDVIRTSSRVTAVGRVGFDKAKTKGRETAPFEIRYQNGKGPETLRADAVIDASGTWDSPNPAGAERPAGDRRTRGAGEDLLRDAGCPRKRPRALCRQDRRRARRRTLRDRHADRSDDARAAGAGDERRSGCFAATTRPRPSAAAPTTSSSPAANSARTSPRSSRRDRSRSRPDFRSTHVASTGDRLRVATGSGCCGRHVVVDELIVATGFRPDLSFLSEIRLRLDPAIEAPVALAPLIDPNEHSCGTVRPHGARELVQDDPGFYLAGIKIVRPGADLPDDHRLRTGALDRRRHRRRPRGRRARRAGASGDRRVHARRCRRRRGRFRMLRRPGTGRRRRLLRGRCRRQGRREDRLRMLLK